MKIEELITLCNPLDVSKYRPENELTEIAQDSRKVPVGGVFIAIRGSQVDGHMFIEDAIERGASVVICEDSYYTDKPTTIIEVEDTRAIFGKLAQAFAGNPAKKLSVIGITGTNGKTTTATLVYKILTESGRKASLLGTVAKFIEDDIIDSKLTTADPIELAADMKKMVDAGSEYLVMEVSSHALHQERVTGIDFDVAAFTNISHDHLDYHETFEEYAKTKKLLFDQLKDGSHAIINADDEYGSYMAENSRATIMDFGFETEALYSANIVTSDASGITITVEGTTISSSLVGKFNAYNLAEAYLICKALELPDNEITEALDKVIGAPGRMETIQTDGAPKVVVDYAHTPDALENVLKTLKELKRPEQKLIVVFGCGGDRDKAKRPAMAKVTELYADRIIVTSDNPRTENPDLIIADILNGFDQLNRVLSITDRREAITRAINDADEQDLILIAGKGHETYQEINGKRIDFDDREVALDALKEKSNQRGGQ